VTSSRGAGRDGVRLSLITEFELREGDAVVPVAPSAQRLVAFVALRGNAVRRLYASGVLWGDVPEQRASASLRSALWRTPTPSGRPLIDSSGTHLWLDPSVSVDLHESISHATEIIDHVDRCRPEELRCQLRRLSGDLLPDWYDDWLVVEREHFRQLRLHALEAICLRLTEAGEYALALDAGFAAIAAEPLRESAQRLIVHVHLLEGNVAEALRHYRAYSALLADSLGITPTPSMQRLVEQAGGSPPASTAPPVGELTKAG
jgi:DNA-binding SARP family transcriptional activator